MQFPTIGHLRYALREHFIKIDRQFFYVFNDTTRLRAKCQGEGCNWVLYARKVSKEEQTVRINTLVDVHDCGIVFDNKHVNSSWLANHFLDQFRLNPNLEYKAFKEMTSSSKFSHITDWHFIEPRRKQEKSWKAVSVINMQY